MEGPDTGPVWKGSDPGTMAIDPAVGPASYAEEAAVQVAESRVSNVLDRIPPDVVLALGYVEIPTGAPMDPV